MSSSFHRLNSANCNSGKPSVGFYMNLPLKPKTYPISTSSIKPYKWLIKNPVDPYFGGSFFSLFCRLFLPGGGLSRSHVLIHGCLVRNQASGLENQRGLDTYESIFWGGLKEMKKKKKSCRRLQWKKERILFVKREMRYFFWAGYREVRRIWLLLYRDIEILGGRKAWAERRKTELWEERTK